MTTEITTATDQPRAEETLDMPIESLTPREIVAELDRYIVGQHNAKRAVAIALRNRYRRARLGDEMRDEVIPKNILMIGPTGVGKTEIARRLAKLARAPFLKVEATKFTEVGYVGRDVDSMVRDLVQTSVRLVEGEMMEAVKADADGIAVERIVDILHPRRNRAQQAAGNAAQNMQQQLIDMQRQFSQMLGMNQGLGGGNPSQFAPSLGRPNLTDEQPQGEEEKKRVEQDERIRQRLKEQIAAGGRDNEEIEIEVEETGPPSALLGLFNGPGNNEEMGMDLQGVLGQMMPKRKKKRRVTIKEARKILGDEAARGLIDHDAVSREAVHRAEQSGIIFIDELDKVAGRGDSGSPDVSRGGVQRDLLPIIEGSTVQTRMGPVRTNYMLFIAAGAFHVAKPSDLIPELQGRLPIRVELESLNENDFRRILTEPKNAITRQYIALLATDGVTLSFTDEAIREIARIAVAVNDRTENIGARRLHTVMERLLDELSFAAPDVDQKTVVIDAPFVRERLDDVAKDEDMSRYIL